MSQKNVTNIDKAAVLLSGLDPQRLDKVMELLGPAFSGELKTAMKAVSRRKDLDQLR